MTLIPVGKDGQDLVAGPADTCTAGAGITPIVRDVSQGHVTQLEAMMMLADCAAECGGADNTKICKK
jgi:hypothetical protein